MTSRGLYRVRRRDALAMNLRHAAALGLVVWYLMVPPRYLIGIPEANWEHRAVFDTKAECESATTLVRSPGGRTIPWTITNPGPGYYPELNSPQCVSSDDPRLR
jgi:hypothetical protein